MPPAPIRAVISYGPSRVPALSDIWKAAGPDYSRAEWCSELPQASASEVAEIAYDVRRSGGFPWNSCGTSFAPHRSRRDDGTISLEQAQRTLLAETLRDIANLAAGAMVFGQFIGSQTFSFRIAAFGMGAWMALVAFAMVLAGGKAAMTQNMWNVVIILGGITVFAGIVTLLDWLGRRRERQARNRAA